MKEIPDWAGYFISETGDVAGRKEPRTLDKHRFYKTPNQGAFTMIKTCKLCNEEKPISSFYRHPQTGHPMSQCRPCKLYRARLDVQAKRRDLEFRKRQAQQRYFGTE